MNTNIHVDFEGMGVVSSSLHALTSGTNQLHARHRTARARPVILREMGVLA